MDLGLLNQTSPYNINTSSREKVMRINKMITKAIVLTF